MMNRAADLHLYILAGGHSRRFGSQDKALTELDGVSLIQAVIDALSPAAASTTIVTGAAERYTSLGYRTITDRPTECGPIGGLAAALHDRLRAHGTGWLFLAGCDLVRPSRAWFDALLHETEQHTIKAVAYRGEKWEPMYAFYHTDLIPMLDRQLKQEALSLQALLERAPARSVALPEGYTRVPQANTPQALRKAMRQEGVASP